ncbi:MAG: bifunctional folylpolyglutamate synthase/dihydrofolate synthase, partial [Novosphingobium sp.]
TAQLPNTTIILDGGHNPDAAQVIAAHISTLESPVAAIVGMLANKDAKGFLDPIAPHVSALYAIPVAGHDHHAPADLAAIAAAAGVAQVHTAEDFTAALRMIASTVNADQPVAKTVLIAGSLYLAGKVLEANDEVPD